MKTRADEKLDDQILDEYTAMVCRASDAELFRMAVEAEIIDRHEIIQTLIDNKAWSLENHE